MGGGGLCSNYRFLISVYDNFAFKSGHGIHVKTLMGCVTETLLHIPDCLQSLLQVSGLALIRGITVECIEDYFLTFLLSITPLGKDFWGMFL